MPVSSSELVACAERLAYHGVMPVSFRAMLTLYEEWLRKLLGQLARHLRSRFHLESFIRLSNWVNLK